jgi:DNA repair protein RecO (recombination protein O)
MSSEKTEAIVIRLADFSESSRVVTLFTREAGKVSALAKGAKRLKGPFESALDLLSRVRVVFLRKSSANLDLLTEAQLVARFQPLPRELTSLYGGYYVAELLDGLTETHDPHPLLYDEAVTALAALGVEADPRLSLLRFEAVLLRETGHLPAFDACLVCGRPAETGEGIRYWVNQGGLVCRDCGRPDLSHTEIHPGTILLLNKLAEPNRPRLAVAPQQMKELRRVLTSAVSHALERRPKMLSYLKF